MDFGGKKRFFVKKKLLSLAYTRLGTVVGGKLKKVLVVVVTAFAKSARGICFNLARQRAVWMRRAGSFIFCLRIGSGDI